MSTDEHKPEIPNDPWENSIHSICEEPRIYKPIHWLADKINKHPKFYLYIVGPVIGIGTGLIAIHFINQEPNWSPLDGIILGLCLLYFCLRK